MIRRVVFLIYYKYLFHSFRHKYKYIKDNNSSMLVEYESSKLSDIIEESLLESEFDKIEYKSFSSPAESSRSLPSSDIPESRLDYGLFLPTNTVESTEEDNILVQKLVAQLQI
ncbi:uncharacterized protein CIMG_12587 [Coccidioides immitis RS]|uniref:Uncharacterized protein n=1 Tax=Coccidioides immitis (strain RS) TaxID=246410 RepID=J3K034_COCIM|nr:uncharacterized protein CIMG_12587 [Coccidioides immitis RS]EAS27171.3 hypothetical protein CIMG_12587 [Coccidioides immitis RS]